MNYETIILELLSRVQTLEEKVKTIEESENDSIDMTNKMTTLEIKKYIDQLKLQAKESGKKEIVLVARDIAKELELKQRYPMICNAMRQAMNLGDEVLFSPASGYSSTLKIKYFF